MASDLSSAKSKRIEDKQLLKTIRSIQCIACGAQPPSDAHHITTKKSGGHDTAENLISLCRKDHALWHQKGAVYMFKAYPSIRTWLELAGRDDILRREEKLAGTCDY